ncbi:MAG: hypothetical protein RLZZ352_2309 [Pseudomonadota bacterium]|jgi:molybdate transport system substrate-binding protein
MVKIQPMPTTDIAQAAAAPPAVRAMSSMATRGLLAELLPLFEQRSGHRVQLLSVGGVDAARRVMADEALDVVLLAADALQTLLQAGKLRPGTLQTWVLSSMAAAVPAGHSLPDISTEAALRQTLLAAPAIGYSTGPSGTALLALFERWGLLHSLQARLVQAPPGVPVSRLLAGAEVALGFQQRSELLHQPGIQLLGPLPPAAQIVTPFAAAVASTSSQPEAAQALIHFLAHPDTTPAKQGHGMQAA